MFAMNFLIRSGIAISLVFFFLFLMMMSVHWVILLNGSVAWQIAVMLITVCTGVVAIMRWCVLPIIDTNVLEQEMLQDAKNKSIPYDH